MLLLMTGCPAETALTDSPASIEPTFQPGLYEIVSTESDETACSSLDLEAPSVGGALLVCESGDGSLSVGGQPWGASGDCFSVRLASPSFRVGDCVYTVTGGQWEQELCFTDDSTFVITDVRSFVGTPVLSWYFADGCPEQLEQVDCVVRVNLTGEWREYLQECL